MYTIDRDWRFTHINASAEWFAKKAAKAIVGTIVWDSFPDLIGTEFETRARLVMAGGETEEHEGAIEGYDVWAQARIYPAPDGIMVIARNMTSQRKSQKQMQVHEMLLNTIAESVIAVDIDGVVQFWNLAAERLYGFTQSEALGGSIFDLVHAPASQSTSDQIAGLVSTGLPGTKEFIAQRKDGSEFLATLTIKPTMDRVGAVTGSVGISRDVTAERAAEAVTKAALAEADFERRRLAAILEASPIGYWIVDADGNYTHSNPAIMRIWGGADALTEWPTDSSSFKAWRAETGERLLRGDWPLEQSIRAGKAIPPQILKIERFDGTIGYGLHVTSMIRDAEGKIAGAIAAVVDITEKYEQEIVRDNLVLELEYERTRLADVFQQAPNFMAVVRGKEHVFELANDAYYQHIGTRDIVGKTLAEALPELVRQKFGVLVDKVYESGITYQGTDERFLITPPDGVPRESFVDFMYAPLKERDGTVSGVLCIGTDVTSRHNLEANLRQAQRMEAVGNLAGGIAHDFNNLLTVIQNCCEFLLEEVGEPETVVEDILEIQKASHRAANLTKQLLAFSRRQLLQPKVLELGTVLTSLTSMLSRMIGEDVRIEITSDKHLGLVKVDQGQVEQVIVNLCVNARDAMPRGGRIDIVATNVRLDVSFDDESGRGAAGPYVMISVSDNGTGMTPEIRDRVFEPFFTTKDPGRGTGLGLSTAYGIIQQSGGRISVYSELGIGTTFRFYLPRYHGKADMATGEHPVVTPVGTETVLLVEDDDSVRALAKRVLERGGYRVIDTNDGREAIKIAKATPEIGLLLTDVVMPHMMGTDIWDAVSVINTSAAVLFMSGYTSDDVVRRELIGHGAHFVQKPFTPSTLLTDVRRALDAVASET